MIRDTETLQILLDSLRQFVGEVLIPRENEVAETDAIPKDIVDQMREMGLFGLTIPEAYGGLGVTMEEEVNIAFELGRTSPAFRSYIGTNNGIGSIGILLDGTEEQRNQYLPQLASGELLSSFCLSPCCSAAIGRADHRQEQVEGHQIQQDRYDERKQPTPACKLRARLSKCQRYCVHASISCRLN